MDVSDDDDEFELQDPLGAEVSRVYVIRSDVLRRKWYKISGEISKIISFELNVLWKIFLGEQNDITSQDFFHLF